MVIEMNATEALLKTS